MYTLFLGIWECRFKLLIDDSFLLNLFPMFYIIGDFGPKVNLRIEILALTGCMACGQYLPMYDKARFWDHGLMGHILSLTIWELRFEFFGNDIFIFNLFPLYWRMYVIPVYLRIEIWVFSKW